MTDVRLVFENLRFDLRYRDGELETDEGLETAVLISLFTDARVSDEELPRGEGERRGWFGDAVAEISGDLIGSKLWLLDRENATPVTRSRAEEYARDSLQWLLDDGIAKSLSVRALLIDRSYIELDITIDRPNIRSKNYYRFQLVWEGQSMQVRKVNS